MISVSDGASTTTYTYNGDGDRMSQTIDGVTTSYVLDTATPLTMVLAETTGTETIYYLNGLDLVAQSDGVSTEYFGYDGLGNVRQVLDDTGNVLLAQAFDPYGNLYASAGADSTSWGFTGEMEDGNGLIFLWARYYDPGQGRFLQRDPWKGDKNSSASFNPWMYVSGNPINFVDPSGMWRWWLANPMYHMPIEDYYESLFGLNPNRQLEYPIPGTPFRHPDMFNSLTGDVYEIEPIFLTAAGAAQVQGYVTDLNIAAQAQLLVGRHLLGGSYDWNQTSFRVGLKTDWPGKFRKTPLSLAFPLVDLVADYVGNGVVAYWIEPNALAPVLLGKKISGIVPNKKLLRPRNWIPSSLPYQPAYAIDFGTACGIGFIVTGGTILVVTIVEDATLVGLVDDIVTIPGGILLINYGLKLATIYPVP